MTGDLSAKQVIETFEESAKQDVRDMARVHTDEAIMTLVTIMRNKKNPPGARRAAAKDILDQGWGRPDSRGEQNTGNTGVTIIINKLSTGETRHIAGFDEVRNDIIDAEAVVAALKSGNDE